MAYMGKGGPMGPIGGKKTRFSIGLIVTAEMVKNGRFIRVFMGFRPKI